MLHHCYNHFLVFTLDFLYPLVFYYMGLAKPQPCLKLACYLFFTVKHYYSVTHSLADWFFCKFVTPSPSPPLVLPRNLTRFGSVY